MAPDTAVENTGADDAPPPETAAQREARDDTTGGGVLRLFRGRKDRRRRDLVNGAAATLPTPRRRETGPPHRVLCTELNDDGTVGGSYQVLFDIVTRVDRRKFEPVALFHHENDFAARLRALGVEVHLLDRVRARERAVLATRGRLRRWFEIGLAVLRRARLLRRLRIDLLHLNNSPHYQHVEWLSAALLAGVTSTASAMTVLPSWEIGRLDRWLIRRLRFVLPVSEWLAGEMKKALPLPPGRVMTVRNGIDADEYRARVRWTPEEVRADLRIPPDAFIITMVGNVRAWKGQDVLIAALARLDEARRTRVYTLIVGAASEDDIAYEQTLRDDVSRAGLDTQVLFLGARPDVPDLMNAADVVVHASTIPEPFGLVVIEAMALGKPVLASAAGGPLEIITPGSGILYPPGDSQALARAIQQLMDDPTARTRLGTAALQRVREFSLDKTVRGVEVAWERALARSEGSPA